MLAPGVMLAGRYRLGEQLGTGGMATVYRAVDIRLHREVAIKLLALDRASSPTIAERFLREARAMAALNHPAIVAIFDVEWSAPGGEHGPFLVMELVSGGTLAERLTTEPRLGPEMVADLADRIASGLAAMHAVGLVHRDVKPQNILLGPSGPKLADLGVVRLTDPATIPASELTATETTLGTLRYLAPEVLHGEPAGPPADSFALAMVAFQALTGQSPRPAVTLGDLIDVADLPAPLVSAVAPELGRTYDVAFTAALDLDPRRRADVLTFATGLRRAVRTAGTRPTPPMTAAAAAVADATTERVAMVRRDRAVAAPHRRSNRHGLAALAGLALVVTVSLFALGSIASRFLATGATPLPDGPAASSTAIVGVASPSSSSSPSATQQSSPSEPPEPTENPLDAAIADLRAAIEGARGGGDLKGKDVNDLFKGVADIERAIADGNVDAAGEKARKLEDRVRGLIDKDEVGGEAGDRLLAAATTLARLLASG